MEILSYISKGLLLLSILIHLFHLVKKGGHYIVFSVYLLFIFILEVYFHILRNRDISNIFLTHYYFIGQALILSVFYKKLLISKQTKKIQWLLNLILYGVLILNIVFGNYRYTLFDHVEVIITNLTVIVNILLYLYDHIDKPKVYYISTAALLVYTISSTTVFLSGNLLLSMNKPGYTRYIWTINIILFLLLQASILYEAIKTTRKYNYG